MRSVPEGKANTCVANGSLINTWQLQPSPNWEPPCRPAGAKNNLGTCREGHDTRQGVRPVGWVGQGKFKRLIRLELSTGSMQRGLVIITKKKSTKLLSQ